MQTEHSCAALDPAICEQARLTRDARFDGLFFTAVKTTGIYCRPVCPAPTPKASNISYYPSAAAAAAAGFRPCLRCRPEAAPGSPLHHASSELVKGALRLIEQGALDGQSVSDFAARVGVGERQLRRLFDQELGASPLDVAATRRLLFAKQLLADTRLPITAIAGAAGYASLRRFNAAFVDAYKKPPRDFRRGSSRGKTDNAIELRLPYRAPYDFAGLLAFYERRTIAGVESVNEHGYRRSFVIDDEPGWFSVSPISGDSALRLSVHGVRPLQLGHLVSRVRRMFDVDADPVTIMQTLQRDRRLRPLAKRWPGQRLPGAWDGFELGVRAVLGQQISVAAARTLAARIVKRFGTSHPSAEEVGLGGLFPTPTALADAPLESIGVTRARAATIRSLAQACVDGRVDFSAQQTLEETVTRLCSLRGIGAWTAHYIAMRAHSHPDAFPAGDLVLRKIAGDGTAINESAMQALAEAWRPWRAYAVMLLWRSAG
ncbi:MAG TPA: AlkA N-terminal domain-containing protein [Dokdonella sp.]|uniref:DNA-3-methyladenine glycosylase 2 family protein n=1 Tax=Dokdonella sp. TaxID=2291710 RepID=UPI002D7F0C4C|nr:AlkA N-terminal domain-containing protein [Dokdonella sp.]HET9031650.1 AlkA N-terminal domain-containing protein [Dokdonella sp.]